MRTRMDADALAGAAGVHRAAAEALSEGMLRLHPAGVARVVMRACAPRIGLGDQPGPGFGAVVGVPVAVDDTLVERLRVAAAIEEDLARLAARATVEEGRLRTLSASLLAVARVWAEAEEAVTRGLRALDRGAHDHPWLVERAAAAAQPLLPGLLGTAERWGLLSEDRQDIVSTKHVGVAQIAPPRTVGDLIAGNVSVEDERGRVRVLEVVRADGSSAWVVQISGTQSWGATSGPDVFDLTTDVRAVNEDSTLAAVGVHLALLAAQGSTGRDTSAEPVLLTGHSLGGILAAALAADPTFRRDRNIVGVVTAGSPISRARLPPGITVVALEHTRDAVPRLDGRADPARPGWTTVEVAADPTDTAGLASRAHAGASYARSAVGLDAAVARTPEREAWEQVVLPVLGGGRRAVAHDFTVTREWQNPRT